MRGAWGFLYASLTLAVASHTAFAQTAGTLKVLLSEYRCPVVDLLERIYEHSSPHDFRDRFLVVSLPDHPHGYVQCMFVNSSRAVVCEASSGYYYDKPDVPRTMFLPQHAISSLARLGFSTDDSKGNFRYQAEIGVRPDLNGLADLILTALHDGYDARAGSKLKFNAPFARRTTSKCMPVS